MQHGYNDLVRSRAVVCLLWFAAVTALGRSCLPYDQPVTLTGKLVLRDEAGYRRYHVLRPDRPICTLATPDRPFWPAHSRVTDISTSSTVIALTRWQTDWSGSVGTE